MNVVENSHYISKFALRNWAHPKTGKVCVFNFCAGTFEPESPKRTYVADEAFPPEVEGWLKSTIEDHLGEYLARCKRTKPPPGQKYELPTPTEREWRAIRLWVMTQAGRTALARDPSDDQLVKLVRGGDDFVDALLAADEHIAASYIVYAARERLYFPERGIVGLPLDDGTFAFFVPLHPRVFAAKVPRAAGDGRVEATLHRLGLATALSAGLEGDLVVIPPLSEGVDTGVVAQHLRLARESARELTRLALKRRTLVGMDLGDEWRPPPISTGAATEEDGIS